MTFKSHLKLQGGHQMNYQEELKLLIESVPSIYAKTEIQERQISYKQRNEIVTSTDLFMETEIIKAIKNKFPNDTIHSEEYNRDTLLTNRTWLIDPIDGTSNYANNLDLFVVQIALYDMGEVVLSYIYLPRLNKTFSALKGQGAYLNGKRISVYKEATQANQLMSMVGLSHQTTKDKFMFKHLIDYSYKNDIKVRILGSLGFEMSAMAEGAFVMLYTDVTNYWDIAPGLLLIREAGGVVVNQTGNKYVMGDPHIFCFCNESIKEDVIASIQHLL